MSEHEKTSILYDRLMPEADVEDKFGWSRGTAAVKRCRQTMPIEYIKIGRQVRYRASDVDAFLAANTTPAAVRVSA